MIGSEINKLLGIGAREGYEGSVLEDAWLGDCTRDDNAEIKMRPVLNPLLIHLSSNSLIS